MIIQAGFDLQILARPYIEQNGMLTPNLVLVQLDAEMRFEDVDIVADNFQGSLEPFQDAILDAMDPDYTRYFAIAHPGRFSEHFGPEPILDEARLLDTSAAKRGFQLIGHFAIDETGYMSARAHSYFDQYPSHEDLPRTMLHWAHSTLGRCG